jgi:NAD(P)-dependent dehydrogenase (short-subunit alcohol dehydrogenase family)
VRQSSAAIASRTVLWKRESWPSARDSPYQQSTVEDLAQSEAAKQWIDEAVGQSGRLDVLYNNAASVDCAPIESMTPKLWTETLRAELDIKSAVTVNYLSLLENVGT